MGGDHANTATALQFTKPVEQKVEEGGASAQLESTTEMWMLVTAASEVHMKCRLHLRRLTAYWFLFLPSLKFFCLFVQGSIVWVFEVDIESGGIRAAALNICCGTPISVPRICVKQIRFYSPLCNTPPFRYIHLKCCT